MDPKKFVRAVKPKTSHRAIIEMQGTLVKGKSIKVSQSYVKPNNNSLHTAQHFDPAAYVQSQAYQSLTPPPGQGPPVVGGQVAQVAGQPQQMQVQVNAQGQQVFYPAQQQVVYGMQVQPNPQSNLF